MSSFARISLASPRLQEIEFSLLLGWALLFPDKHSYLYFLGFIAGLTFFTLGKIVTIKSVVVSRFSVFLFLLNLLFIFGALFSSYPFKSLLFASDVLLVSIWFAFFFIEKADMERYLRLLAFVLSVSSLAVLVFFAYSGGRGQAAQIFANPILQGIASSLAALVFLHALLGKHGRADWLLLGINVAAVIVSASKAAFLGLALFAAAMMFARKRRWLVPLASLLLLLALTPNPLQRMVFYSLRRDPYVLNRLDIWNMSARMFRGNLWTGVGPDLFMDAAQRFNFPQKRGPARYFKLPESAHSDYWQIIAETGLPGLLFVLLALFFAIRRMLSPPCFTLTRLLLAFLLAQMLLINFVFNFFFLLAFFLLLQDFLSDGQRFIALKPAGRLFFSMLLVFSLLVLYLFPFLAQRCLDEAAGEKDIARSFSLLQRAALLSPLDERPPLAKAEALRFFAGRTGSMEAWADAWASLRLAQKLNRNGAEAYIKEVALFREFLGGKISYPALGEVILRPLSRAERLRPFNPFLKMEQAVVLREFGRHAEARVCAQAALDLEPDYAEAIVFLHDLDGLPAADPALKERLARIREKAERLRARPGSYLSRLHQLPVAAPGQ